MLKKVLVGGGAVLLLAVFVFGWERTVSYVDGAREYANTELDDKVPMDLEASRIQVLIRKENEWIISYEDKVADLEGRRDGATRKIDEAKRQLVRQVATLQRVKTLLDQKKARYTIGGDSYSFAEVNNDALKRLKDVKTIQETIAFHESLVRDLDVVVKQGRGNLAECHKKLVELASAMERLEAKDANADVRLELAKLANSLSGAPLVANSELEKAYRNYQRRVEQKERRATSRLSAGKAAYRIDYDAAFVTEDASSEIGKLLAGPTEASRPPVEAPVQKPDATDALENVIPE